MLLSTLYGAGAAIGAWHTWNALRPVRSGRRGPLWLPALLTSELALHHVGWQMALTAVAWPLGVFEMVVGRIALGLSAASWAGLGTLWWRGVRAGRVLRREPNGWRPSWWHFVAAVPRLPPALTTIDEVSYGPDRCHVATILRHRDVDRGPVLLQVHGGSWMRGSRSTQARPLLHTMAMAGWICVSIDYRLSPTVAFPDHLIDVKRAIAWCRTSLWAPLGGGVVAITGGSSGGHLAALAALTEGASEYQPGFEEADTAVDACITFYPVLDLMRRDGKTPKWRFIETAVMQVSPRLDPDLWRRAGPINRIHRGAPPFLLVHGDADSLVRVGESARFHRAAQEAGAVASLVTVGGGTHGFDYFWSPRTAGVVSMAQNFLHGVREAADASR